MSESINKNMVGNFAPPIKGVKETKNNEAMFMIIGWTLIVLTSVHLALEIYVKCYKLKEIKKQENGTNDATTK